MKSYSAHEIAMMPDWSELRASKGLSLETIANITNITLRKLEAIERHDFAALGTPTFATGYIRSYAKILKEDADIFVQVYRDAVEPEVPASPAITQSMKAVAMRHGKVWQKFSVLHVLGLAILLWVAVVFISSDDSSVAPSEESEAAVSETAAITAPTAAPLPTDAALVAGSGAIDSASPESLKSDTPALAEPVSSPEPLSAETASLAATSTSAVAQAQPQTAVGEAGPGEALGSDARSSNSESVQVPPAGADILEFSFDDDCWVEVKGADDRVLIAETKRKGDNLRLFGQAPFSIHLGNARVVSLSLNGETVKIEPKSGRNTLRFVASL